MSHLQHMIKDSFLETDRFGHTLIPFVLNHNIVHRTDVPQWRIRRSKARSMGSATFVHDKPCRSCGGLVKRVYDVQCWGCFKLRGKKK